MPGPGSLLGDAASTLIGGALDQFYKSIWAGGQALLRAGFEGADQLTTFSLTDSVGGAGGPSPLASVWPTMRFVAMAVALGLFLLQLILTALRGGRGVFRAVTGPLQFGLAMALTVGGVAALLAASDGLTTMLLEGGLGAQNFAGVLDAPEVAPRIGANPDLGSADEGVRAVVLGFAALFGVIPASFAFMFAMLFRMGAVLVLVGASPVFAAGLLSDATSSAFWRGLRWILAAVLIKPTLALVLVIGVKIMASVTGVAGLVVGSGVLLMAVFAPMTLYRLMAFVDPATGPGQALRTQAQDRTNEPGSDGGSSEFTNITRYTETGTRIGDAAGSGGRSGSSRPGGGVEGAGAAGGRAAGGGAPGAGAGGGAGASGGAGAGSGAGAGGGAAAGAAAGAVVGMAIEAGRAVNEYSNDKLTAFAVGHPPGPPPRPSSGPSRGPRAADSGDDSEDRSGDGDPGSDPQEYRGAVSEPDDQDWSEPDDPQEYGPPERRADSDGPPRRRQAPEPAGSPRQGTQTRTDTTNTTGTT